MTDPTQYIVDHAYLNNVLKHEGVLGKGTDFLTNESCSLHLFTDQYKRTYVMQQYQGVNEDFVSQKMTRMTKTAHALFGANSTRLVFVSTRKSSKNLFDLSLFYDTTNIYGYSLEYIIKMKIKNDEKFGEMEVMGFFWQIFDFIALSARHTGQYLEITPVNIFCKTNGYHGYNFFPNNFGLNFIGTKWERKYHNPQDQFFRTNNKTIQSGLRSVMFIYGMVLLQLSCLLPPSDLYTPTNQIDEKALKKRIQAIKITVNPQLSNIVSSLLILDEHKRLSIEDILSNKQLLKSRRIDFFKNKAGIFGFMTFDGIVDYDQQAGVGEGIDEKLRIHRGKFQNGVLSGFGFQQSDNESFMNTGIFENGQFKQGLRIKKNQYIQVITQEEDSKISKGIRVTMNIEIMNHDKSDKNCIVACEGQFEEDKLIKGKKYFIDGRQEIV